MIVTANTHQGTSCGCIDSILFRTNDLAEVKCDALSGTSYSVNRPSDSPKTLSIPAQGMLAYMWVWPAGNCQLIYIDIDYYTISCSNYSL